MIEELKSTESDRRLRAFTNQKGRVNLSIWDGGSSSMYGITVSIAELAAFLTEHIPGFEATYVARPKPIVLPTVQGAVIDADRFRFVLGKNGEWFAHTDVNTRRN